MIWLEIVGPKHMVDKQTHAKNEASTTNRYQEIGKVTVLRLTLKLKVKIVDEFTDIRRHNISCRHVSLSALEKNMTC